MISKKYFIYFLIAGLSILFSFTNIYAGKDVADVFKMQSPEYTKHTRAIVEFTHNKHTVEYKISCGDCHHDSENNPLTDLKMGDDVQRCIECHKKPGIARPPRGKKWPGEKRREFHATAVHDNCIPCHRDYNKKNKTKAAPASCVQCHPRQKK